jgi:hypothetical protein
MRAALSSFVLFGLHFWIGRGLSVPFGLGIGVFFGPLLPSGRLSASLPLSLLILIFVLVVSSGVGTFRIRFFACRLGVEREASLVQAEIKR